MILKNRVAIVTGAGSGIGRAGARIMAREGATVCVADRDEARAGETVDLIRSDGGTVTQEVIEQYGAYLWECVLRRKVRAIFTTLVRAWVLARKRVPGWPQTRCRRRRAACLRSSVPTISPRWSCWECCACVAAGCPSWRGSTSRCSARTGPPS